MKIRYFGIIRDLTGEIEIPWDVPATTLRELLAGLSERHGGEFRRRVWNEEELGEGIIVLINGRDARQLGGMEAALSPEDIVFFLPVAGGGSGQMITNRKRGDRTLARVVPGHVEQH